MRIVLSVSCNTINLIELSSYLWLLHTRIQPLDFVKWVVQLLLISDHWYNWSIHVLCTCVRVGFHSSKTAQIQFVRVDIQYLGENVVPVSPWRSCCPSSPGRGCRCWLPGGTWSPSCHCPGGQRSGQHSGSSFRRRRKSTALAELRCTESCYVWGSSETGERERPIWEIPGERREERTWVTICLYLLQSPLSNLQSSPSPRLT